MNTQNHQIRIMIYIIIGAVIAAVGIFLVLHSNNTKSTVSLQDKLDLGHKYLVELSYDKAVLEFTDAIEIDPMNADSYLGLADAYIGQGDTDKAVEVLEKGFDKTGDDRIKEKLDELKSDANTSDETTSAATSSADSIKSEEFVTIKGKQYSTSVTELLLQSSELTDKDISELNKFTNLTYLDLSYNSINNINAIADLNNLTELRLLCNQITDISPISGLTNLTRLSLTVGSNNDLSALSGLINLDGLCLDFNSVNDISSLSALKNLTHLSLYCNHESIDISPLSNLTNLVSLLIESDEKIDLKPISNMSDLEYLYLFVRDLGSSFYGTNPSYYDISPLSNLKQLKSLEIRGTDSEINLSYLSDLSNLEDLWLDFNEIDDVSPLKNLTKLEQLVLSCNNISDISPLENLTNLQLLYLDRNPVKKDEIENLEKKLPNLSQ